MSTSIDIALLQLTKKKGELQTRLAEIDTFIQELEQLQLYSDNNPIVSGDSLETMVLKKYLELSNVKKVAEFISELGYRFTKEYKNGNTSERKYTAADISSILTSDTLSVDKELQRFAYLLYEMNYTAMEKMWV